VVDRTIAVDVEVLRPARRWNLAVIQGRQQAEAIDRLLRDAVDDGGGFDARCGVEHGRHEIGYEGELLAQATAVLDARSASS
jgi:endonuclease III